MHPGHPATLERCQDTGTRQTFIILLFPADRSVRPHLRLQSRSARHQRSFTRVILINAALCIHDLEGQCSITGRRTSALQGTRLPRLVSTGSIHQLACAVRSFRLVHRPDQPYAARVSLKGWASHLKVALSCQNMSDRCSPKPGPLHESTQQVFWLALCQCALQTTQGSA